MKRLIATVLVLSAAGCATLALRRDQTRETALLEEVQCVAIMPFSNQTQEKEAGRIVADLTAASLRARDRFAIREPWEVVDFLSLRGISLGNSPSKAEESSLLVTSSCNVSGAVPTVSTARSRIKTLCIGAVVPLFLTKPSLNSLSVTKTISQGGCFGSLKCSPQPN